MTSNMRSAVCVAWSEPKVSTCKLGIKCRRIASPAFHRNSPEQHNKGERRHRVFLKEFEIMPSTLLTRPLEVILVFFLLPFVLMEYLFEGISLLFGLISLLQLENRTSGLRFITSSYNTADVIKAKFPNSIAVRS